ncbi:MAG: hypothetical protein LUI02_01280 [Clostridiales bacterium]|nr:hypothetical protein [Clostridiales bacterium]
MPENEEYIIKAEGEYAREAASKMAFEAACGGAIRHLADLGYTAEEIVERLDFPAPYEKVQKIMEEHIAEKEKPKKYDFVQEHDKYGRITYRRVEVGNG